MGECGGEGEWRENGGGRRCVGNLEKRKEIKEGECWS